MPRGESVLLGLAMCLPFCSVARLPPNAAFWGEWAGAVLFSCWLASRLWRTHAASPLQPRRVSWVALAFPALGALVALQLALRMVRSPTESLVFIGALALAGAAFVAASAMLQDGERPAALRAAAWGLLAALLANAVVMVMGWSGYGVIVLDVTRTGVESRAIGLIGQANQLGALAVMAFAAAGYLRVHNRLPGWAWGSVVVVAAVVCAASGSRIALIEWLLATALAWWHARGAERNPGPAQKTMGGRSLAGSLAAFLVVQWVWVGVAPLLFGKALTVARGGDAGRLEMLRDGLAMWSQHPWLGVGNGNYAGARLFELTGNLPAPHADHAHNILVQALAEWGPPGLLLVGAALWLLLRAIVKRTPASLAAEHVFAGTVVLCLALHSMVEHPLWFVNLLLPFAWFAGLLRLPARFELTRAPARRWAVAGAAAVATIAASLVTAFDYGRIQTLAMRMYAQGIGAPDLVSKASLGEISRIAIGTLYPTEAALMQARSLSFDPDFADFKFAVAERALRGVPSPETVARYVAFSALSGRLAHGQALLADLALRNASLHSQSVEILRAFATANPLVAEALPKNIAHEAGTSSSNVRR